MDFFSQISILKLKIMSGNTRNVFKILIAVVLASAIMAAIPPTQDGEATVIPGTMVTTDHHHEHKHEHEHNHEHHHSGTSAGDYDFSKDKFFQDNEGGVKKARNMNKKHQMLGKDKRSWGPSGGKKNSRGPSNKKRNRQNLGENKSSWGPSGKKNSRGPSNKKRNRQRLG